MSHHEDGEGSGSLSLQTEETKREERVATARRAIGWLQGEDLSPAEADQLHRLLLEKVKTLKPGIVYDS